MSCVSPTSFAMSPCGMMPILSSSFCFSRSWDLNKICYKSGVPIIENGMIERVSGRHGMAPREPPHHGGLVPQEAGSGWAVVGMGFASPRCCQGTTSSAREGAGLGSPAGLGQGGSLIHPSRPLASPPPTDDREAVPLCDPDAAGLLLGRCQAAGRLSLPPVSLGGCPRMWGAAGGSRGWGGWDAEGLCFSQCSLVLLPQGPSVLLFVLLGSRMVPPPSLILLGQCSRCRSLSSSSWPWWHGQGCTAAGGELQPTGCHGRPCPHSSQRWGHGDRGRQVPGGCSPSPALCGQHHGEEAPTLLSCAQGHRGRRFPRGGWRVTPGQLPAPRWWGWGPQAGRGEPPSPTFLLFTGVFVRESRGGLCIVSKRSPALSHANAALKAAPCQTDEIVALFRLLLDGRRGKGPQHPQTGLGDRLFPPRKTSGSPPSQPGEQLGAGSERGSGGRAERDAGGIVRRGGQHRGAGLRGRQGDGGSSGGTQISSQLGERVPGRAPRLSAGQPIGTRPPF